MMEGGELLKAFGYVLFGAFLYSFYFHISRETSENNRKRFFSIVSGIFSLLTGFVALSIIVFNLFYIPGEVFVSLNRLHMPVTSLFGFGFLIFGVLMVKGVRRKSHLRDRKVKKKKTKKKKKKKRKS